MCIKTVHKSLKGISAVAFSAHIAEVNYVLTDLVEA